MTAGTRRIALIAYVCSAALRAQNNGPYDPRPDHLWNRLHAALYERVDVTGHTYGRDELDPLLWISTHHLLTGPSHQAALVVLDEFLSRSGERQIRRSLERAILQRDLWAIFDWCALRAEEHPTESRELQARLAEIMKRVALAPEEVQALPDNYSAAVRARTFAARYDAAQREVPFLPPDLFDPKGPWVCVGLPPGDPVAIGHTAFASGRSVFLVFLNLPGGRDATLHYLQTLQRHPHYWRLNPNFTPGTDGDEALPAADLPQFPAGTQVALVRRLILVNTRGELAPAPITESVQIRVYRAIQDDLDNQRHTQDGFEFRLSREKLFREEAGGLYPLDRNGREFLLFMSQGHDDFEKPLDPGRLQVRPGPALAMCGVCHQRMFQNAGIYSVLSYADSFSRGEYQRPVRVYEIPIEDAAQFTIRWKHNRYDWGLLEGLWTSSTSSSANHPAGGKAGSAASPR